MGYHYITLLNLIILSCCGTVNTGQGYVIFQATKWQGQSTEARHNPKCRGPEQAKC